MATKKTKPKNYSESNMFSYELPDGGLKTLTFYNVDGQLKFDPPVYEQRYTTVARILEDKRWKQSFKKIVEFGCSEMRFLPLLRRVTNVEHILQVDVDEDALRSNQHRAVPLISDYLKKRENPLRIEVLKGSISARVEDLRNADAVIGIEIIEHLYEDTLKTVPDTIFGFIQPKLAILTTPNAEFNVLFEPLLENGFRHLDHKFEWTRLQFKEWCLHICERYPNYKVALMGLGKAPPERKSIGHCTQVAIFARTDLFGVPINNLERCSVPCSTDPAEKYNEIFSVDYPYHQDNRTKKEKIAEEIEYQINRCRNVKKYLNRERSVYQIPINELMIYVREYEASQTELLDILKEKDYNVQNSFVVLQPEPEEDDDYRYSQYDDLEDWRKYERERVGDNCEDFADEDLAVQGNIQADDYGESWD